MNLWLDVCYAIRTLHQNRGFTIVSALTLALGIGANTAMFSIIRAVFLRALPIPHEERLVKLWQSDPEKGLAQGLVTPANFVDWEAQSQVFEQLGVWPGLADSVSAFNIVSKDSAERVRGMYASSGFFRTLGVQPVLGRTFLPEEDRRQDEAQRAALLSHAYWRERFGADPAILGKTIEVDTFRGGVYKIVGVLPPAFDFPQGTQVFLPLAFWGGGPLPHTDSPVRCCPWFAVVGRLKPGVSMARAESETTAIARRVSARHPEAAPVAAVKITPFREDIVARYRLGLFALFGAVACVLAICCVNVANLVLSRVLARRGEMAIRKALGATTGRLARQILVESLVLSALGAAAGMLGGA